MSKRIISEYVDENFSEKLGEYFEREKCPQKTGDEILNKYFENPISIVNLKDKKMKLDTLRFIDLITNDFCDFNMKCNHLKNILEFLLGIIFLENDEEIVKEALISILSFITNYNNDNEDIDLKNQYNQLIRNAIPTGVNLIKNEYIELIEQINSYIREEPNFFQEEPMDLTGYAESINNSENISLVNEESFEGKKYEDKKLKEEEDEKEKEKRISNKKGKDSGEKKFEEKKINEKENKERRIIHKKGKKFLKEYERDSGEEKFEEKKFDEKERKNLGGERAKKIIKNKIEKSQNYVLNQNMFNKKRGNQRAEILGLLNIKKDEKKGVEGKNKID